MSLFAYPFLLPLVVPLLSDSDVVTRLWIVNKQISRLIPRYAFKKMCNFGDVLLILSHNVCSHEHNDLRRTSLRRVIDRIHYRGHKMCRIEDIVEILSYMKSTERSVRFTVSRVTPNLNELNKLDQLMKFHPSVASCLSEVHLKLEPYDVVCFPPLLPYLTHLSIRTRTSAAIPSGWIPDSVTDLDLGIEHSGCLQPQSIPSSVQRVKLRTPVHDFPPACIPSSVEKLVLFEPRNTQLILCHSLEFSFPSSLKYLDLSTYAVPFAVGTLPSSLTALTCSSLLLSVLDAGTIPDSVTSLRTDSGVTYIPNAGVMPDSVVEMWIAVDLHHNIRRWDLPSRLTHLTIQSLRLGLIANVGVLPATITHLSTPSLVEPGDLAHGLTHLEFRHAYQSVRLQRVIPRSVTHLKHVSGSDSPSLVADDIPSSVTHLQLRSDGPVVLTPGVLPSSVTHLRFSCITTPLSVLGVLPSSLTHLQWDINTPVFPGVIPLSVTHIMFGDYFDQEIAAHVLPPNLTHLCFGKGFNKMIAKDTIPDTVTHLFFGEKFNHPLENGIIPRTVTNLAFGSEFTQYACIPKSVTNLELPNRELTNPLIEQSIKDHVSHLSYKPKSARERFEFASLFWLPQFGVMRQDSIYEFLADYVFRHL